ncbi:NAD(P)-binding domain-containing protein [Pedobacter jamesrossensis]|uniref:NAD(P)-binding domain-containing protein n=1 Tax=Pedobacter jamesrossensis TaxID=1908238 RepID=UPI003617DC17
MNIVLLGSGNVATHLAIALKAIGENIVQVFSPNFDNAKQLADKVNSEAINQTYQIDS